LSLGTSFELANNEHHLVHYALIVHFNGSAFLAATLRPFRITFFSNADEVTTVGALGTPANNEQVGAPGGIIGFALNWRQDSEQCF